MLSASRLVTLTGPGGVGKTRLARRLADTVQRAFPDGVWLVELADVFDADLVPLTVAEALGLQADNTAPLDGLITFLRDKRLLLLIDNCEHLVDSCAALASKLLGATPAIRILLTSREVIGVEGEQVLPIPPLPAPADTAPAEDGSAGMDAVELLTERVASANPEFEVTEANRATLAAICRRLEGIPLAVELAALRFRVFTPDQILARLDDAMKLLTAGLRTAPRRQQTLDATMRWSYDLCSRDEQWAWEQLSVFAGGFELAAAEAVCPPRGESGAAVVDAIANLVDKSILTLRYEPETGTSRYFMLEPLRQFGAAQLEAAGDRHAVRGRHRDHYRRLAAQGHVAHWGPGDMAWFLTAKGEHANIRAALDYSLTEHGDNHDALEIATGLRQFWEHCGFLLEGYRWLSMALEHNTVPTAIRARALSAGALLALLLSETSAAIRHMRECADLARHLDVRDVLAETTLHSSLLAFVESDPARALSLAEDAESQSLACGHHGLATESVAFAFMCSFVTNDSRAEVIASRFLDRTTEQGSHLLHGLALWSNGLSAWRAGDQHTALGRIRESIELFSMLDQTVLVASGFDGLAWTTAASGDNDTAARLMGAAYTIRRRSSMRLAHSVTGVVGDEVQRQVREALGERAFTDAFDAGAALTATQAVDFALGRPTGTAPPSPPQPRDVLTRRERDVARLVGSGYSNKRIAAELVISIRTAETHVEHILTKLGFRSRTQIATWVSENDV